MSRRPRHRAGPRPRSRPASTAAAVTLIVPVSGVLATSAGAAPSDIVTVTDATRAADAQRLLKLINAHRASEGLAPVKCSATLARIVQGQSDQVVNDEVVDHADDFMTDPRAAAQ